MAHKCSLCGAQLAGCGPFARAGARAMLGAAMGTRVVLVAATAVLGWWALASAGAVDSLEARRQAYLCSSLTKGPAIAACRRALELGLSPRRAATAQLLLALNLSALHRWPEAVAAHRERVRLLPDDAEAHWRLGDALLFGLALPSEALAPLREAVRLKPDGAGAYGSLGTALATLGQYAEAVAAFERAQEIDPQFFTHRPAARRIYDAAQRGERWGG